eukprot:scaffold2871_cov35-Tisochrysis_lutea.AAC.2
MDAPPPTGPSARAKLLLNACHSTITCAPVVHALFDVLNSRLEYARQKHIHDALPSNAIRAKACGTAEPMIAFDGAVC